MVDAGLQAKQCMLASLSCPIQFTMACVGGMQQILLACLRVLLVQPILLAQY
jgi:hypothetical protein